MRIAQRGESRRRIRWWKLALSSVASVGLVSAGFALGAVLGNTIITTRGASATANPPAAQVATAQVATSGAPAAPAGAAPAGAVAEQVNAVNHPRVVRPAAPPVPQGAFVTRIFTDDAGRSITYYLYGPASYDPTQSYPLVLVLHGGGERINPTASAEQNRDVLLNQTYVQPFTAAAVQQQWPSFVVVPQLPADQRWVNVPAAVSSYTLAQQPSVGLALAKELVDSLLRTYPAIDGNRVYIAGISMGGFGVWEAIERWPQLFAAALPIAGAGDPQAAAAARNVPVWAFHGSGDTIVPVQGSQLMVQALRAAGGAPCYTEYPNAAHDIWNTQHVLSNPAVLSWLFSQTKAPNASATPLSCAPLA